MAGWPCRGAPRGLGRMSARSVALTLAVVLATARPAATRSGEDFLSAALLPSAAPAVAARPSPSSDSTSTPGACSTSWTTTLPPRGPRPRRVARHGVRLRRLEGPAGITPARVDSTGVFACAAPSGVPHGFLASASAATGASTRDFSTPTTPSSTSPPRRGSSRLGPGLWSRGDPVTLAGRDMLPRSARDASPGELVLCGWTDDDRAGARRLRNPRPASSSHPRSDDARPRDDPAHPDANRRRRGRGRIRGR